MPHRSGRYVMLLLIAGLSGEVIEPKPAPAPLDQEEYLDSDDWFESGLALNSAGNYRGAAEAFARSIAIAPDNALAWMNLGTAKALYGDYSAAIDALKKAVRLDPHLALGFANLGEVYFRTEHFGEAVEAYTMLLSFWPSDANAHYKRGLAYIFLNDAGKAQAEYLSLKLVDPGLATKLLEAIQGAALN